MIPLKRGSKGDEVRRLQALLCLSGFDSKPIDGDFGGGTERALRAFQQNEGLAADGEARDDTQCSLGMDQPDPTKVPHPVCERITVDMVARMFAPTTPRQNIERYLPPLLAALKEAGLDDRDLVLMALATIRAESEGFEPIDEGISRFNTDSGMHPFNRYDDRADLGNRGRPDGERYKGRGFIQLTGRANYRRYGESLGLGTRLEEQPELANDPTIAARILAAFIKDKQTAAKYAIYGRDLATARRLVNGGSHGFDRFSAAFDAGEHLLA